VNSYLELFPHSQHGLLYDFLKSLSQQYEFSEQSDFRKKRTDEMESFITFAHTTFIFEVLILERQFWTRASCVHLHIHVHIYIDTYVLAYIYVYKHTHVYSYMHAYIYTHTYIHTHTYMHACIHTFIHT
jgi:hypothetical protein